MESVLVVEDEMISSLLITRLLQDLGFRVVGTAITGAEALEKALRLRPDLLIMDVGLKGDMDGTVAAIAISEQLGLPVLFVSGYTPEEIGRGENLPKIHDFLTKPIVEEELARKLRGLVRAC